MPWSDKTPEDRRKDAKTYGPEYRRAREQVRRRANGVCEGCGHRHNRLECDHIHPGGGHSLANLRMLCKGPGTCKCHDQRTAQQGGGFRQRGRQSDPEPRRGTQW